MLGTTSRGVAPAAERRVPELGVRTTQSDDPTSGASGKATRAALSSGLPESGVELSGRYILPFAKKANDEALGAALQTMSLMVPSPPSDETSPGVAAEIRRLNTALAPGLTPSTASSDPGAASATRKMLTRKPTKTPSRVSDTLASSESGDAAASTPSKAPSERSLTLKREIEATTPAREVVHRSVSGEAPNTDTDDATKAPFADDVAFPKSALRDARVSIDSPLALSREPALATEKAAVAERVRVYETAESRAALAAVEKKLGDVERDLQKARREAAETARRAASLERTNARLRRELVNGAAAGAGPTKSDDALVDEQPKASKEDHKGHAHTVSSAALYVDVERLSAELRDTKRRLAEANAASAAADAEKKKVFDEMLAAANEVADDLERERARCHRAEHELGKAKATAHARDETRLGEIIEVKSELALAKASLRVEKEKTSHILAREDHHQDRRPSGDDSPNVQRADATLDARRERERLRLELSEARSAAAKAEARASSACASAAGARTAAALAEEATRAVEARRDGIETKLREDLRAARRTLRRAAARGDTEASAVCHEDDDDDDEEGDEGFGVTEGGRKRRSFVSFAKRSNGAALFSATALFALVFFLAAPFVAGMFRRRRDDTLGYECAAQWRRTSGVLDEVLSGTLGAPFRRDDVCDVAAPPAT